MLTVLGGLAEFEPHLILSWTNEGRSEPKLAVFGLEGSRSSLSVNKQRH